MKHSHSLMCPPLILLSGKELNFYKNDRSRTIKVAGGNDLKVWLEDSSLADVRTSYGGAENIIEIQVTIPRNVDHTFKNSRLFIENSITGQKGEILLNYLHESSEPDNPIVVTSSSWPIADILTIVTLFLTFLILLKCILWPSQREGGYNRYKPPGNPQAMYRTPAEAMQKGNDRGTGGAFRIKNKFR